MSYSRHADKKLDELYERQNRTLDVAERERLVQEAEVPVLWRNRIIVHNEKIKGWSMSPSHFQGTDLVESGSTSRRAQAFGLALARTAVPRCFGPNDWTARCLLVQRRSASAWTTAPDHLRLPPS